MSNGPADKQPLGDFVTRCEDNGRIRLPSNWLHFFTHDLGDKKVFITSLEGEIIRIYPESIWRANLALFRTLHAEAAKVKKVLSLANHYGTESALEAHGKVLVKPELRSKLAIAGADVVGSGVDGVIHIHLKAGHDNEIAKNLVGATDVADELAILGVL